MTTSPLPLLMSMKMFFHSGNLTTTNTLNWTTRRHLCISAAPVTSERVFSTADNIVLDRRTNLLIGYVERLVFLKENMKVTDGLQDIQWPG